MIISKSEYRGNLPKNNFAETSNVSNRSEKLYRNAKANIPNSKICKMIEEGEGEREGEWGEGEKRRRDKGREGEGERGRKKKRERGGKWGGERERRREEERERGMEKE